MNIAICDDDLKTIAILENIVSDCFCGDANRFFCESFTSGEELLNYLVKPINTEKTKNIILTAIDFLLLKQSVFHFKTGKKTYSVIYGDIECRNSTQLW